ncbi:MAG: tail fiber domain-containing protein [Saprospiraceae bacterium]|nr:tail fiber domain-containing protein [Saprospiraceae bacterium]
MMTNSLEKILLFLFIMCVQGHGQNLDVEGGALFRMPTGYLVTGTPRINEGPAWQFYTPDGSRWDAYAAIGNLGMVFTDSQTPVGQRFRITANGTVAVNKGLGGAKGGLHIKQFDYQPDADGIFLEHPSGGNSWNTLIDILFDYQFSFDGNTRAYISHIDGSHHAVSDRRLKQDIHSISSVLPAVRRLNPVTYKFKSNPSVDFNSWGFIAQEVEEIFPDFVQEKEGLKTLAYDNFAVVAIKAIQEQQEEIEELKKRIDQLEKPK